jgi:hypothetical protein
MTNGMLTFITIYMMQNKFVLMQKMCIRGCEKSALWESCMYGRKPPLTSKNMELCPF